jgi:repressor LexA
MKTSNTSARLKTIMSERGLRQVDILAASKPFCDKYGIKLAKNDLSQYVNGKVEPGQEKLSILGMALNVSEAWLMGYDVSRARDTGTPSKNHTPIPTGFSPMPETELVPRIGRIACGDPITAEENVEDQDEVLKSWHADFTLVCCGDSMVPKIEDGDVVAIRSQPTVENGEIAAVRIGDEATLKRVFLHPDYIELRPLNPEYDSIIRRREEMSDIRIEGLAVGLCRNL